SAGSASGVLPNPVGHNRVYVHVGEKMDYARWWAGLKAGRCFVTNGPLLLCKANGELPGHVFRGADAVRVELDLALVSNDRVPRLEVVRNGEVVEKIELPVGGWQHAKAKVEFRESGWFLVRAIADVPDTFRFASTAPYYVE